MYGTMTDLIHLGTPWEKPRLYWLLSIFSNLISKRNFSPFIPEENGDMMAYRGILSGLVL